MSIRDFLGLDHFYIGFDRPTFDAFKVLVPLIKGTTHQIVQSGSDTWEGIYLSARDGTYWEIVLRDKPPNNYIAGVALSARSIQYIDASQITQEMPWLNWKKGLRINNKNEPWFEYCATGSHSEVTAEPLDMWTMKYFPSFRSPETLPQPPVIESFDSVEIEFNAKDFAFIKESTSWAPGQHSWNEQNIILNIPKKNWSTFVMTLISKEDVAQGTARLRSLSATVIPGFAMEPMSIGSTLKLVQNSNKLHFFAV